MEFFIGFFFLAFQCIIWIFTVGIGLFGTIFWILMLIDALKKEESEFKGQNDKIMWVLILIFTHFIGAIIYYFMVKRDEKA